MARTFTRSLTLILGVAIVGSIAQAAPPVSRVEGSGTSTGGRPQGVEILLHDRVIGSRDTAYATDYVVVRFAPSVAPAMRSHISRSVGGRDYVPARFGDFGRVRVTPEEDLARLVRRLESNPDVEFAELDPLVWTHGRAAATRARHAGAAQTRQKSDSPSVSTIARRGPRGTSGLMNSTQNATVTPQADPFFDLQWYLSRIRVPDAETLNSTRGSGVVVAVIDSGVLFGSGGDCVSSFPRGRGPDLGGVSFVPGVDLVDRGTPPFDEGNADEPGLRRFGHGTAVAAQIAAAVDNDLGGRGVAPRVAIMPIRVFPLFGGTPGSIVAEAIRFAADNGADVINLSLGGPEGSQVEAEAVRHAHSRGVVLVASSGNDADEEPGAPVNFPAAFPEVVAVGASDFNDRRASYSNSGPELELTAPAGGTGAEVGGPIAGIPLLDATWVATFLTDPVQCGYTYTTGTSFAAPQVSAAAALLKAIGVQDPEVIRTLLQNGARDIGAVGFDSDTGHGLLDLFRTHAGFGFSFE